MRAWYKWNLDYNPDPSIRGDLEVKAVGSSSLVSKEERTASMDLFSQNMQPEDKPYINRRSLLEERIKAHDLDAKNILLPEDEVQKNIANAQDSELRQLELANLEADKRYTDAKAANMEAKADETTQSIGLKEIETMIGALEKMKKGATNEKVTANS